MSQSTKEGLMERIKQETENVLKRGSYAFDTRSIREGVGIRIAHKGIVYQVMITKAVETIFIYLNRVGDEESATETLWYEKYKIEKEQEVAPYLKQIEKDLKSLEMKNIFEAKNYWNTQKMVKRIEIYREIHSEKQLMEKVKQVIGVETEEELEAKFHFLHVVVSTKEKKIDLLTSGGAYVLNFRETQEGGIFFV